MALFTWKLDATDVFCMAGHANVRTTLLMYVGSTAGVLDRARARPPTRPCPSAMRDRAWLTRAVACPVPPRRHGGTA